jgi:hypothetical protein
VLLLPFTNESHSCGKQQGFRNDAGLPANLEVHTLPHHYLPITTRLLIGSYVVKVEVVVSGGRSDVAIEAHSYDTADFAKTCNHPAHAPPQNMEIYMLRCIC